MALRVSDRNDYSYPFDGAHAAERSIAMEFYKTIIDERCFANSANFTLLGLLLLQVTDAKMIDAKKSKKKNQRKSWLLFLRT